MWVVAKIKSEMWGVAKIKSEMWGVAKIKSEMWGVAKSIQVSEGSFKDCRFFPKGVSPKIFSQVTTSQLLGSRPWKNAFGKNT